MSLAMAEGHVGLGQERCLWMSTGGQSMRSKAADGVERRAVGSPFTRFFRFRLA